MSDKRRATVGRRAEDQWAVWDKRIRDMILFTLGASGIISEFFLNPPPDFTILGASLTLVGVPVALFADARRRSNRDSDPDDPDED
jgi:hypothetical protein